ncbi:MAG: SGNH/GDSL hydrolase family protein [Bryobacterales bacterium]|nr:SGNH/GDSL hydrolase family protein [Bryobacterales bacterium]
MPFHNRRFLLSTMVLIVAMVLNAGAGDLMKDSPVTFPEKGPLPAKYPPDMQTERETPEPGYTISASPERSLAQIARIQAEMAPGTFTLPKPDWQHLPRTRRILTEGGDLHVLGFGDSIVNDTMRSGWLANLGEAFPQARIRGTVYVRGGGGCQHYREENRIVRYIVPRKPDLVFIGGISQRDTEFIRECIQTLRAHLPEAEILLASGAFGANADPRDPEDMASAPHSGTGVYGQKLRQIAFDERCAYLDMTTPWAEYLNSAEVHPHRFYRDRVHANEFGEQILSKILLAFFTTTDNPQ